MFATRRRLVVQPSKQPDDEFPTFRSPNWPSKRKRVCLTTNERDCAGGNYPAGVATPEQRNRWGLCLERAAELFEKPIMSASVRMHARVLYDSHIPTST